MSEKPFRVRGYLEDIDEFVLRVETYTADRTEEQFLHDIMLQDAVLRNILVIGEAAQQLRKVLPEADRRFPSLPLARMALQGTESFTITKI